MTRAYLFDIDGTLANNAHRQHHLEKTPKDWPAFLGACDQDTLFEHIAKLARDLACHEAILFVTGRGEEYREKTEVWLEEHGLLIGYYLYMRPAGDFRPDHEVKVEILQQIIKDGFRPIMAFDDRTSVVKAWRAAGIPCAQVAEGDF